MINPGIRINPAKQVELIKKAPYKAVLAITGGATGVFNTLMRGGGASSILLEGTIPYDYKALAEFLGGPPDKACNERTARQMAMAAFQRGLKLKDPEDTDEVIGLGLTCSLVRPGYTGEVRDDGSHRKHVIHVAYQTRNETYYEFLELRDYDRSRECEEDMAADLALQTLARGCCVESNFVGCFHDTPGMSRCNVADLWSAIGDNFVAGNVSSVVCGESPWVKFARHQTDLIFPGSFNPTTKNHRQIAQAAAKLTGKPVLYEMAIVNADKPPIDYISLSKRLQTLPKDETHYAGVLLTRAAKFTEKAKLFPGSTFAVGADTWNRIVDPRFYPSTNTYEGSVYEALDYIGERDVKFLIFQRKGNELPKELPQYCTVVPLDEYEDDGHSSSVERKGES